jgi:hypothetical protein
VDEQFLKKQIAHCRSLAETADRFTKRRLLDLAARYENILRNRPSPVMVSPPQQLPDTPPRRA